MDVIMKLLSVISALIAGLLFGIGLMVSGMANPAKVLDFLDVFGRWDPSLAFVMVGAIATAIPGFLIVRRRSQAIGGEPVDAAIFQPSASAAIDRRLIIGSAVFGIGWGTAGFCPGPAFVATAMAFVQSGAKPVTFLVAMIVGMLVFELALATPREAASDM
jgi:uncharacterized protein